MQLRILGNPVEWAALGDSLIMKFLDHFVYI